MYSKLKNDLEESRKLFFDKWQTICDIEYAGNFKELYDKRLSEIFEDLKPIWQISYQMSLLKEEQL